MFFLLGIMLDWRLTLYLKVEPLALFNLHHYTSTIGRYLMITLRSFLCQTINSSRYAVSVALRSNTQVLNSFTISLIRNVAAGHGTFSLPVHSLARTGLFGCLFGLRVFSISGTTCPVTSSSQHRWYSSRRNSGQLW